MIERAKSVLQHLAEQKQVRIEVESDANEADRVYFDNIFGDEARLVQIIVNLMSNSVKFSEANSKIIVKTKLLSVFNPKKVNGLFRSKSLVVSPAKKLSQDLNEMQNLSLNEAELVAHNKSNKSQDTCCYIRFQILIQDFGCGIPQDKIDSLFVNFNKLSDPHKKNPNGRGLGLSICKAIVDQMGGSIEVKSGQGEGTTFVLEFVAMS